MGDAVQALTELRSGFGGESERIGDTGAPEGVFGDGGVRLVAGGGGFVDAEKVEVVKRKRGRPPRAQGKVTTTTPTVKENDEEDVCFICFDGGSLVLCDRRGCPKAYHPACIRRDEAFFQSAAKWNCGWHICSSCQKSSHFMCYTCTFSLCKGCTKGADFWCVRGNKGFCNICLNMVKLIENSDQGNNERVQVDFDDKTSWEYLFKVYWIYLKTKLSLTFDELTKAKRVDMLVSLSRKGRNSDDLYANNRSYSDSDYLGEGHAIPNSKRRKTRQWPVSIHKEASQIEAKVDAQISSSLSKTTASKELLEFVSHMKRGDPSFLTPFDAQTLILQYIKINGLRDPNCPSQIICDSRLMNLFGKARVGHIEMLKLVEYHFPSQEDSPAESVAPMGRYDTNGLKVDDVVDETSGNQLLGKDLRHRGQKRDGNKGPEANHDGYAAIDVHNINLIYLPLHLMEKLLVDDEFHEKAVGSVVRIKMSSGDQKQDLYRLVQVVGTIRVDEPYQVRNRFTSWKLEILNISKKEVISVDEISDQEFSEDECKRFCQSIKYGLATRFKVGEILEKSMALRAVKVANFLEREILCLSHLRDRASEKGQNKEFKEYVDKIELLNSPGERQRLQNEIPVVHEDPNMDPRHQSEEDSRLSFHKKDGDGPVAKHSGMKRKGGNPTYLSGTDSVIKKNVCGSNGATDLSASYNENRKAFTSMLHSGNSESHFQSKIPGVVTRTSMRHVSAEVLPSAGDFETEKIWYYQDPSWNVQGPFSMLQLRKWNTSGYFPLDLRIWRTGEKQNDSIILTDALDGQFGKKPRLIHNACEMSIQSNTSSEFVRSSCSSSLSTPAEIVVNSREGQCADSVRSHESLSSYSQLSSSPSTQTLAGKACEALSLLAQERWDGPRSADKSHSEHDVNQSSHIPNLNSEYVESQTAGSKEVNLTQNVFVENTRERAVEEKQSVPSIIPAVDSCRSSITDSVASTHQPQPNSTFNLCSIPLESQTTFHKQSAPYVLPVELEPKMMNSHLVDIGGQTEAVSIVNAKHTSNDSDSQCTDTQAVVRSDVPLPDTGSSWTGGSCSVNANKEPPPVVTIDQNAWNSNPPVGSLPKPNELIIDVPAAQPATDGQYGVASPFQFWHSIFGEDEEFPFADESVSDLLAEVDAMEFLNGPVSPNSAVVHAAQFSQTSKEDCFASNEDLNLTLNSTNGDTFSSTLNLQISCQPPFTDKPH